MTLHEAIEDILNEHSEGLSYSEIASIINRKKLYLKKDNSPIKDDQIRLRVKNYGQLFSVENGKVFLKLNYHQSKLILEFIIADVLNSTAKEPISKKYLAIPLLFFIKRVFEADSKEYKLDIPHFETGHYELVMTTVANYNEKEFSKQLLILIDTLCTANAELESLKSIVVSFCRNNCKTLLDIFTVLNKYSFDSKQFSKDQFGFFFNDLLNRLTNSILHKDRSSSPNDINELLTSLFAVTEKVVMDPFAGSAGTLITLVKKNPKKIIIGYEKSEESWLLGKLNLFLNGINSLFFYNSDSLMSSGSLFSEKAPFIISDIPFSAKFSVDELSKIPWATTKNPTSIYIEHILNSLDANGKAVILIPFGFLFNTNSAVRGFKEMLIENNWLNAVISLPQGIFLPYSAVASAIICIDLNRIEQEKCLFIDATDLDLVKTEQKQQSLTDEYIEEIASVFNSRTENLAHQSKIKSVNIEVETIRDQGYDLTPKRYIYRFFDDTQMNLFDGDSDDQLVELKDLLTKRGQTGLINSRDSRRHKFVMGSDLKNSIVDFTLYASAIEESFKAPKKASEYIDNDSLLILTNFKSLKPTFFVYENEPVYLSNNVKAFEVNIKNVDINYLIAQLQAPYFLRQLEAIRKGTAQQFFSITDFLRLKISLPPTIDQQLVHYEKAKEEFLERKAGEVDTLTKELIKQKAIAASDQIATISSIQHELGNKLPSLKHTIDDLKRFFLSCETNSISFSMETKIRPVLPGETMAEVDSVNSLFERAEKILSYTISMVDDAGGIITSDPSRFKPQKIDLIDFLENEINNFKSIHGELSNIKFEIPKNEPLFLNIDKKQWSVALNNLIQNALRHGFIEKDREYNMVFQVIPDDNYAILLAKNDGAPFPDDFSIEKYKQPFQFAGKNGHSGFGGFIINRVIENHKGFMDLVKDVHSADNFKVQFKFQFPKIND